MLEREKSAVPHVLRADDNGRGTPSIVRETPIRTIGGGGGDDGGAVSWAETLRPILEYRGKRRGEIER